MSFLRSVMLASEPNSDTDNEDGNVPGLGRLQLAPGMSTASSNKPVYSMTLDKNELQSIASGLFKRLEGDSGGANPISNLKVLGCRGNTPLLGRPATRSPLTCAILGCIPKCECSQCPECDRKKIRRHSRKRSNRLRHPSLRDPSIIKSGFPTDGHGGAFGPIRPTSEYLKASKVISVTKEPDIPLVVISIEGVLAAHLPSHLSGGWTDFLARTYVETLFDYLLHPGTPWQLCFWTGSMKREEALKALRMLKLPTGSPEKDERDGVLGVWSKEDCKSGYDGGELSIKDLETLWDELYEEEGIRWTQENTVVITEFPQYMMAQPNNFILAPSYHYKMVQQFYDDQTLLMLIAALEALSTQSNFSQYIKKQGWDKEETWIGGSSFQQDIRDKMVLAAVRICARQKISIKASGGN